MTVTAETPLNARQGIFVDEYLIDFNGRRAAEAAGYSAKTAAAIASENLTKPNIAAEVQRRLQSRSKNLEITAERVLAEYAKLAYSNIDDYVDTETYDLPVIDMQGLTRDQLAAVSEITVDTREGKDGIIVDKVKFKLHDKKAPLDALGRHLGLFEKDNKQTAPQIIIDGRAADL